MVLLKVDVTSTWHAVGTCCVDIRCRIVHNLSSNLRVLSGKSPSLLSQLFFPVRSALLLLSRERVGLSLFEGLRSPGCANDFGTIVSRPFLSIRPGSFFPLLLT